MVFVRRAGLALGAITSLVGPKANANPLTFPFDFSRGEIAVAAQINGHSALVILDTGVNPSVIDLEAAQAAGLNLKLIVGGEVTGEGNGPQPKTYETAIVGMAIAGRRFGRVVALASDLSGLSAGSGHRLDGVLGYSFLQRRIVLIDYPQATVSILDRPSQATAAVRRCRTWYTLPLRRFADSFPIIPRFRFGNATGPVTLDTGSNEAISMYQSATHLPGVGAALHPMGDVTHGGFLGNAPTKAARLDLTTGFGPFRLPAGQVVTVRDTAGSMQTRVANVGNQLFVALKLRILLNYRDKQVSFFGNCGVTPE
jgi:hypothetical protein